MIRVSSSKIYVSNIRIFYENNFLSEFLYLSNLNVRYISLEIIKSFSVLIPNLKSNTLLYFIFSNNFINQLLSHDYEKYDDEFIAFYINFIKSLSLKLNTLSIQFFFIRQKNSFPLLENTLRYYNHTDPMIRTTVRNIFLTVLKSIHLFKLVRYEPIYEYLSTLPSISYFPFMVCSLRDLIIKMNDEIILTDKFKRLKDSNDEVLDLIFYIQDIFSLEIDRISYIMNNCLIYYLVLPLLLGGIISQSKVNIN